jgi:DNA-binding transcriptional regulator GbsR (MarR family)
MAILPNTNPPLPVAASPVADLIVPDGRPAEVVAFEQSVVAYFLDAADLLGVPKSLAVIYGICFASTDPLSPAEIRARVDLSAGSLSQGLRFLTGLGAIIEVSVPGERAARYAPDTELRKLLIHYLERRVEAQLDAGQVSLKAMKANVPKCLGAKSKILKSRVESLSGWHRKSRALMPLLKGALKLS